MQCFKFITKFQNFNFLLIFLIFRLSPWKKSTILLAFFPYLAQIIISIRGCVACNDLWTWPIFSRSFGLDLENRVHSVASTVLDVIFIPPPPPTTVYWIHPICPSVCLSVCLFVNFLCLPCSIYSSGWILSIFGTNDHQHAMCHMWWPLTLTHIFKVIRPCFDLGSNMTQ